MTSQSQKQPLFSEERSAIHKLLANNPNYFGTAPDVDFPVEQAIKYNTSYEELTCVGLWPERNLLEATIEVKLPFGFLGDMCSPGSHEYVRFFIDWNGDGDFDDLNEDLGVAEVNVHDIPQVGEHPLCYAVRLPFQPFLADCEEPYLVKLRAILSWEVAPTGPDFVPIWGNLLECWIQIDPVEGKLLGIVAKEEAETDNPKKAGSGEQPDRPAKAAKIEKERTQFLELLKQNPNYFGTLPISNLEPVNPIKCDTRYEELKCIGLYPEDNFLEAILEVKLPYGFLGDLCSPGSYEHVRFCVDWDNDGIFEHDLGFASVNVHDIPQVQQFHLCYALGQGFQARQANCQQPHIVKVRAILSWQQVPTDCDFTPVWGNIVECWVQIQPTDPPSPELVGHIDTPLANACVEPASVPTCPTGGAPLTGLEITGTAAGLPFDHYTLRYSWGGNPPVNDAVVYPDCSRPPASISANVPVSSGTLGYLDLTLLPPGVTEFTIYLDVFDAGSGHVAVTRTFKLKTTAVQITAAAKVNALVAEDPFHPSTFTRLIKATNDPNPAVPELSIGGKFSVDGSAYVVGCERIMSQFALVRFDAPPASPVPSFPNATGGAPLIAPVVYADTPDHPWQSGCFPLNTPNTILNGDLVALWSADHCTLGSFSYTVPKVKPVPSWDSRPLNGRYVILLEVRDRLEAGGSFPGDLAAKDQVVVWIDNHLRPEASITLIGGVMGCGDLHLQDFVGKTAEIRGVAWDPPIDPTAPQQKPNDNFGFYSLDFQKNGGAGGNIPAATPNTRVPDVWPGPLAPGADGVLANWDIVGALDGGPGPLPAGSPKLARGERCAYVLRLYVEDTTHVGDTGNHHWNDALYAINVINDVA